MGIGMMIWYIFLFVVCIALAVLVIKARINAVRFLKEEEKKKQEMPLAEQEEPKDLDSDRLDRNQWTVTSTQDYANGENSKKTE